MRSLWLCKDETAFETCKEMVRDSVSVLLLEIRRFVFASVYDDGWARYANFFLRNCEDGRRSCASSMRSLHRHYDWERQIRKRDARFIWKMSFKLCSLTGRR